MCITNFWYRAARQLRLSLDSLHRLGHEPIILLEERWSGRRRSDVRGAYRAPRTWDTPTSRWGTSAQVTSGAYAAIEQKVFYRTVLKFAPPDFVI